MRKILRPLAPITNPRGEQFKVFAITNNLAQRANAALLTGSQTSPVLVIPPPHRPITCRVFTPAKPGFQPLFRSLVQIFAMSTGPNYHWRFGDKGFSRGW